MRLGYINPLEGTMSADLQFLEEWIPERMDPGTVFVLENQEKLGQAQNPFVAVMSCPRCGTLGLDYAPSTVRRGDDDLRRRRLFGRVPAGRREYLLPQVFNKSYQSLYRPGKECQVSAESTLVEAVAVSPPEEAGRELRVMRPFFSYDNEGHVLPSPDGEIGRRSGLKIRRPQGRGGSSPPLGTIENKALRLNSSPKLLIPTARHWESNWTTCY